MAILGVDVGGTFTDAVLLEDGHVSTGKVLTAPRQEESVLAAAHAAGARDVERFAHGTTVATNALLERKGARTAFVTNAGFEHLLHLRRQTRPELYRPCADWPAPLVPPERCHGVVGGHEVAPEFREYARAATTAADAYLGPVVSRYLDALTDACSDAGLLEPL